METAWNPLRALLGALTVLLGVAAIQPASALATADLCEPLPGLQIAAHEADAATAKGNHRHDALTGDCCANQATGICAGHGVSSCAGPAGAIIGVSAPLENLLGPSRIAACGKSALTTRAIKLDPPPPRI